MKCDRARELLSDLHNGELAAPEEERLRRHLRGCADCRAAQQELEQALQMVADMGSPELPADFGAELRQRLEEEVQVQSTSAAPVVAAPPAWARGLQAAGLVLAGAAAALLLLWPWGAQKMDAPPGPPARTPVADVRATPKGPAPKLRIGQVAVLVLNIHAEVSHPAARLRVVLPDGVVLLGEGRREIEEKQMSWTARLAQGDNEIRIPVRARRVGTWRLVARVRAAGFRARSETRLLVTRS